MHLKNLIHHYVLWHAHHQGIVHAQIYCTYLLYSNLNGINLTGSKGGVPVNYINVCMYMVYE